MNKYYSPCILNIHVTKTCLAWATKLILLSPTSPLLPYVFHSSFLLHFCTPFIPLLSFSHLHFSLSHSLLPHSFSLLPIPFFIHSFFLLFSLPSSLPFFSSISTPPSPSPQQANDLSTLLLCCETVATDQGKSIKEERAVWFENCVSTDRAYLSLDKCHFCYSTAAEV